MRYPGGRPALVADAALAAALAAVAIVTTAVLGWVPPPQQPVDGLGVALLGVAGLVLVARRRLPVATLAATTLTITAYLLLGYPFGTVFLPFAVAVYTVARHLRLTVSAPVSLAALGLLLTHLLTDDGAGASGVLYGSAWMAVPFGIGVTARARQEVADRARVELIRAHVDEERLRVAQEVHDIVGHGLAAIKMQADIALHVLVKKPEQAETALTAISRTSSDALAELRATLAAVRDAEAGRAPAPSLDRLDELRHRMLQAGLAVAVTTTGVPRPLPPAVDLAGYRIVQESLTNVLRHSTAHQATVRVAYAPATVEVTVTNPAETGGVPGNGDGIGNGDGSGIAGMRQRVHALGGSFNAGLAGAGEFRVHASLPTGGSA